MPLLQGRAAEAQAVAMTTSAAAAAQVASEALLAATQGPAPGAPPVPMPWTWKVGTIDIVDTRATIVLEPPSLVVEIAKGTIAGLESARGARATVDLQITEQGGTVGLAGTVGIDPLGAKITAKLGSLALDHLLAASGAPVEVQLPTGTLSGEVTIEAEPDPLIVSGQLAIANLGVRLPTERDFAVDCQQLELGIKRVLVPGLLPRTPPAAAYRSRSSTSTSSRPPATASRTAGSA